MTDKAYRRRVQCEYQARNIVEKHLHDIPGVVQGLERLRQQEHEIPGVDPIDYEERFNVTDCFLN
jgi:hypothetical protein